MAASSQDIAAAVDQLRQVVNNLGWDVQATDMRGEEVVINIARAKASIGAGGAVITPAEQASTSAG